MTISIIFACALVSYLHGKDALGKGWLVVGLAILGAGLGYYLTGLLGLLGSLISPLYWFTFRTSTQARAELDYMGRQKDNIKQVIKAYILPVSLCVALVAGGVIYSQEWIYLALIPFMVASVSLVYVAAITFRNDDGETARSNRQWVEIANGLCGGVNVASVATVLFTII